MSDGMSDLLWEVSLGREDIRDEDAIDSHYAKLPIQPMQYSMDNGLDPMQLLLL